jgi:hypothetical protein
MTYKIKSQMSFGDFYFPYGKLKASNRWAKMAALIPWDDIEHDYAQKFVKNGAPAHPARMALGSLIIKQILGCSDEELVSQIAENPYLQAFIGLKEFVEECPFGASTLVAFRKRFSDKDIARINEMMLENANKTNDDSQDNNNNNDDDDDDDDDDSNMGTMALDATVAPSDITYPQDVKLLNQAREHLESIVDHICIQTGAKRPRMYRIRARKDYLNWSKSKRRSTKKTRAAIRRQLGYVNRDLGYINTLIDHLNPDLTKRQINLMETIRVLFDQQNFMHQNRIHSVPDRIVSIAQPWVRPIVRGKACANTEFGAKVHISTDDGGLARIEKTSFAAFNESEGLIDAAQAYHDRTGHFPKRILADQIYRNRKNISWCKGRGIRLSGPRLGRPPKATDITKEQKRKERKDSADRNVVEGVFGTTKTAYGLDPVKTRLEETTLTVIGIAILVFNLKKLMAASLSQFMEAVLSALDSLIKALIGWSQKLQLI